MGIVVYCVEVDEGITSTDVCEGMIVMGLVAGGCEEVEIAESVAVAELSVT